MPQRQTFEEIQMDKETLQLIQNLTAVDEVDETFTSQEDKSITLKDIPERL